MKKTLETGKLNKILKRLAESDQPSTIRSMGRQPVHVVYGGAHLFSAEATEKLGRIALRSIETYAPNFVEFARAMWLNGADSLPVYDSAIRSLELRLVENPEEIKRENVHAWFAWTVYQKTLEKLKREPIEDIRIDFEDGYGIRSDSEEDEHAILASNELAKALAANLLPEFCGFRIKSLAPETRARAIRTLDLFLINLLQQSRGKLPQNFVVTLPKITRKEEVEALSELLSEFESKNDLPNCSIGIEIIVETPQVLIDRNGQIALRSIVDAANGRCRSAHFGAYDFTASFGIAGNHQHLQHESCIFARNIMQLALAPLDIRLSDSVTTEMPVAVHRGEDLSEKQIAENALSVRRAWRTHFNNVTNSMINGFYQSWDLHPAQLAARYAAVYSFFLESKDDQARRLRGFLDKATQALTTGNQFDDAASAQGLLNFFSRASDVKAISNDEIKAGTGLKPEELKLRSFDEILKMRNKSSAVHS
ncbi:MAG: hypothetical protein KIS76_01670 [Pyrinomonadaceae bacterium]|nr:hypothetical protein [Pyrinomonadaceae bacterium]